MELVVEDEEDWDCCCCMFCKRWGSSWDMLFGSTLPWSIAAIAAARMAVVEFELSIGLKPGAACCGRNTFFCCCCCCCWSRENGEIWLLLLDELADEDVDEDEFDDKKDKEKDNIAKLNLGMFTLLNCA